MAEVIATTDRLVLRRWEEGDVAAWLEHLNTPAVTEHLGGPRSLDEVTEKFAKMTRAWDEDGFSFLAMALRSCGTFLGTCGIARIATDAAPEELRGAVQIGWQLRADQWGRGLATEAARAMAGIAFGLAGLDRLYSQTSLRNGASWRVMEKLGMSRRPDLDYDDPHFPAEDNPTIIYALAREDWRP
ncbi:MAG: GNAT family N-acetyltransferase [Sphingobium sp.]|nr:GNAT family N-acetyltransferase [Sphingobium sp.]